MPQPRTTAVTVMLPPHPRRGGAAFTMLLFVLLLISSGLMYFYYMRCRTLEREVDKWRTGTRTRDTAPPAPPSQPRRTPVADKTADGLLPPSNALPSPKIPSAPATTESNADPILPDTEKIVTKPKPVPTASPSRATARPVLPDSGDSQPDVSDEERKDATIKKPVRKTPTPEPARKTPKGPIRSMYDLQETGARD